MKIILCRKYGLILLFYLLMRESVNGQSTSAGTSGLPNQPLSTGPLDYLGWDNTVYFPLELRTEATGSNAQRIDFYTNGSRKMTLLGSNSTNDGYVGLGPSFNTVTFNPNFLLHQDGGNSTATFHQFTNGTTTGTGATNGFLVGIASSGIAEFRQQMNNPIIFYKNDASGTVRERVRITHGNGWNGSTVSDVCLYIHIDPRRQTD